MNQYFYLLTVQSPAGPVSMTGVTVWEHGATRNDIFERIRKELCEKLEADPRHTPVLNFILERNI